MSNSKAMLVRTRLDPSDATQISYAWAESVKNYFQSKDWQIHELSADDAVRAKVEDALIKTGSCVFLFYGHGRPKKMKGQGVIPIIDPDNLKLLSDQICYIVACWTAQELGKEAVKFARCYLGYNNEVKVWLDEPYADHLGKCVNKGIKAMLDIQGCTIEQAEQHIIDEYNYWIDYYVIGDGASDTQSFRFAAILRHNRDALLLMGDRSVTIP